MNQLAMISERVYVSAVVDGWQLQIEKEFRKCTNKSSIIQKLMVFIVKRKRCPELAIGM